MDEELEKDLELVGEFVYQDMRSGDPEDEEWQAQAIEAYKRIVEKLSGKFLS